MIKINLLPQKRAKLRVSSGEPGGRELAIGIAAIVGLAAVVFFALDQPKRSKLSSLRDANAELTKQIASKTNNELNGCDKLKKAKTELDERAEAITRLMNAKVVPANVLHELGEMLTVGSASRSTDPSPTMTDETHRRTVGTNAESNRRFDPNWDPTHVWLISFVDTNGDFQLEGGAQAEVDVTQLAKRMQASVYFSSVTPSHEDRVTDRESGISYYHFTITGKVAY